MAAATKQKTKPKGKAYVSKTLREFPKVGRYRVRLIEGGRVSGSPAALDIREHIESEGFNGFTRRGIRVYTRREAEELGETLKQILEDGALPEEANGKPEKS